MLAHCVPLPTLTRAAVPLPAEPYGIYRGVVAIIVGNLSEAALGSLDLIEAVADMYSLVAMVSPSRPPILPELHT